MKKPKIDAIAYGHLVHAAPDLLSALQNLVRRLDQLQIDHGHDLSAASIEIIWARKAIKKALGNS